MGGAAAEGAAVARRERGSGARFCVVPAGAGGGAALQVLMRKGDEVKAESGALISRSEHVRVGAELDGGLVRSVLRAVMSRESVFFQTLRSKRDDQDVLLAPEEVSDIVLLEVGPDRFHIARGAFLAAEKSVSLEPLTEWDMRKAVFGSGLFVLEASGSGTLAVNCSGSVIVYQLEEGEKRVIDSSHLVAWTADMRYDVKLASSTFWTSVSSGEGFMCYFTGPGEIYVQTNPPAAARGQEKKCDDSRQCAACMAISAVVIVFIVLAVLVFSVVFSIFEGQQMMAQRPAPYSGGSWRA